MIFRALMTCSIFLAAAFFFPHPAAASPLLLQNPTVSRTQIAFVYAGDIWVVGREGGQARRLITGYNLAGAPYFSPDGSRVAFSANYDGRLSVYVVPAEGGQPKRLTYHPMGDIAVGWTRDGSRVLFVSRRKSATDAAQLYTIPAGGGVATMLPLPDAQTGSYSPDGTHFAYVPNGQWEPYWRDYRGGQVTPIWVANLADSSVKRILSGNANYFDPMWIGDSIYYVSDRDGGSFSLYGYDTRTGNSSRLAGNREGFDIVSASANDGEIVYSQFDAIHLYDPASHSDRQVPITIADELPNVRPHWIKVAKEINNAQISPSGVRAVFEAHGEILTVPTEHGDIRNLTQTPGAAERDPAWSPDGKYIAYFSDATGEYTLRIKDQKGEKPARVIELEPRPSYYYTPAWSPDSKKISYLDKHLGMYYVDVSAEHPVPVKFAEQRLEGFGASTDAVWSPDSRYIAYTIGQPNFLRAVYIYDTKAARSYQITDGMSDSSSPAFDGSGKYLYFLSSTNTGFNSAGLDMESDQRPTTSSVYAVVLKKSLESPVAPESDEETGTSSDEPEESATPAASPKASPKPKPSPEIDFAEIGQRIVSLPIPQANYVSLQPAGKGHIVLGQAPVTTVTASQPLISVIAWDTTSRKTQTLATKVKGFIVSSNGKKMLLQAPGDGDADKWSIVSTTEAAKDDDGSLDLSDMEVYAVPHEEWAQMYRETWRIERDFFYDPHYHGLDITAAERRFAVFLPGLASRDDFTYLTERMIGYLEVGHLWVDGPEPTVDKVSVGMLGADYSVSDGRYRFAKIYNGENWNPQMRAPLTQPGVDVKVDDYLLAVNGQPVRADREVYAAFEETADKQTIITVGPNPNGTDSHNVTVVPLASERALRYHDWIDQNRRTVERLSGGRLGYVHLPDTEYGGFTNFNRYYFAQVGKEGIILDERYNHGGQIADYIIDVLSRKTRGVVKTRDGAVTIDPPLAINGPKVMLINQYAGSGGDALPWLFRKADIGPLVGVRTWGGLVGIGGYPTLMDGGDVMAPRAAIGGLHGQWEVEGHGIAPDLEVQEDPAQMRNGNDNQLEAAVNLALKMLREHPVPQYGVPAYPNHNPQLPPK